MTKIAFTGSGGNLGNACRSVFGNDHLFYTRKEFDITDHAKAREVILNDRPDAFVHMAAMAGIQQCEDDNELAYNVNTRSTLALAKIAHESGVKHFIFLSTACVFNGSIADGIPNEDTLPYPKHYYGLTKYIAEEQLKTIVTPGMKITIVRTNFAGMPWEYPRAFIDRFGTYLFAEGVANGIKDVIEEMPDRPIIHICGDRRMSMYEYAVAGNSTVEELTLDEYNGPPLTIDMSISTKYWKKYTL